MEMEGGRGGEGGNKNIKREGERKKKERKKIKRKSEKACWYKEGQRDGNK